MKKKTKKIYYFDQCFIKGVGKKTIDVIESIFKTLKIKELIDKDKIFSSGSDFYQGYVVSCDGYEYDSNNRKVGNVTIFIVDSGWGITRSITKVTLAPSCYEIACIAHLYNVPIEFNAIFVDEFREENNFTEKYNCSRFVELEDATNVRLKIYKVS